MTNQEQYESMIIPDPLYTVDHDKAALNAAKMLKEYCLKHNSCLKCPLYAFSTDNGCLIYNKIPQSWEV